MGRSGLKVPEICLRSMTFGHSTDLTTAGYEVDVSPDAG